jgi:hypothetical protein
MTLKIAVFAPTPSASVRMATIAKPGDFRRLRSVQRMSFRISIHRRHAGTTLRHKNNEAQCR